METFTIQDLERYIAVWQAKARGYSQILNYPEHSFTIAQVSTYRILLKEALNRIAELASWIATMKMKGETDNITTCQALNILGISYTYDNGAFYIHS